MLEKWFAMTDMETSLIDIGGKNAFLLDERDSVYYVQAGKVDIFAVTVTKGRECGARSHLFQREAGSIIFGIPDDARAGDDIGLLVTGSLGSTLLKIDRDTLRSLSRQGSGPADLINEWLLGLSDAVVGKLHPRHAERDQLGLLELSVATGHAIHAGQDHLWVEKRSGSCTILGLDSVPLADEVRFHPLPMGSWVLAQTDCRVQGITSNSWLVLDPQWLGLDQYHLNLLRIVKSILAEQNSSERERMAKKSAADQNRVSEAMTTLSSLLSSEEDAVHAEGDDPLLDVCRKIGHALGISIVEPPAAAYQQRAKDPLAAIARASRIRTRRVALHGAWWTEDNGPMVACLEEGKRPVALLQSSARGYLMYDPQGGAGLIPVTRELAGTLEPFANVMYRTFPCRPLKGKEILSFALKGRGKDIAVIIITGIAGGLLGLLTPVATGLIFDTIIPGAQLSQLLMLSMALLVSAISTAVFNFTRSIAVLRLEGRMDQHVQGAVWDRLLELPVPFFREYSAGDLADRAMGINAMRQVLSGSTINGILSGIFSVFNLLLLFWYSTKLALVAIAITLVALVVLALSSVFQLHFQKKLATIGGKLSGLVLEVITGIAKFRCSGSEGRVFSKWATQFAEQRRISKNARLVHISIETFSSVYPIISTVVIFVVIVWFTKKSPLSIGSFLAFNASFGQFLQSVLGLAMSVIATISIFPYYQRCKPILQALPETDDAKADPGVMTGEFEVSHLCFRYLPDTPPILDDISIQVRPGEFVALVGSSGSGKSTLLRLLLGFEKPDSGSIFYDAQDVSTLDVRAVRQQMGVVLQNGQLMSGDIFTNIVGSSLLTVDDAWEAARMAGLAEDVKAMPMGIHTVVAQGGGTLSGGQRQRLLIARALVSRPRILFFDEATSALDNKTQAVVNGSLEKLQTTRVVIAHRLSTIEKADRIYVLDQGKIVQCGNYQELIVQEGLFAELAKRQIA